MRAAERSSLFSNTRALVGGRLLGAALAWIGTLLVVRTLTQESFGEFSFVFALLAIVSIVADLGLGRIAVSGVMGQDATAGASGTAVDRGVFAGNYIMLRSTLGFVAGGVALAYVWLSDQSADVRLATLIGCAVVLLSTPTSAFDVAFQAHDRMAPVAMASLFGQLAATALVVSIAIAGGSMVWFVVPAVLREMVELSLKVKRAHRLVPFRYELDLASWWPMLKEAVPLSIGTAIAMVYYRIDAVMLKAMDTSESVAVYAVGYKFADLMHIIPFALTTSMLASMVRYWPDALPEFRRVTRHSGQLLMLIAGLAISGFVVFGGPAISLLYGASYVPGTHSARVLMISEGLIFFSLLAFTALVATGRHAIYPIITIAGLVANVGLNLVFIPKWSFEGAAYTTLITECLVAVLLWHQMLRIPGLRPIGFLNLVPIGVASVLAGGAGWLMWQVIPWPLAAVMTVGVYVSAVLAMGVGGERGLRGLVGESLMR